MACKMQPGWLGGQGGNSCPAGGSGTFPNKHCFQALFSNRAELHFLASCHPGAPHGLSWFARAVTVGWDSIHGLLFPERVRTMAIQCNVGIF